MTKDKEMTWKELFPNGRTIYYEGDNPSAFVTEMKAKFNFDPSKDNPSWCDESGYCFRLPGRLMNEVYGSYKYPLGS